MRSGRRAHLVGIALALAGTAHAQPGADAELAGPPVPPGAATAAPTPAGRSAVESSDVPPHRASPERFAVVPFENRSGVRVFDWLIAAAPFEIATKTEGVLGLEPTGGPLYVGADHVPAEPGAVAVFAAARTARWVVTGWVERPNWELRLHLTLWKITGTSAAIAGDAERTGPVPSYHALLGDALGEAWTEGGLTLDATRSAALGRPLARDVYAVNLLGRGLGHLTGALPAPVKTADARAHQLEQAARDLERAVFIDPKVPEAQRVVGELYLALAASRSEPKLLGRAAGKFNYAHDLAPDDPQALRAAATAAQAASKAEVARELFQALVTRRPWDLDARYQLGAALWATANAGAAERQLAQVTAARPEFLPARRVLALIHASRSDTRKLVDELEAIARRAPDDLDTKADLATAYGALSRWKDAIAQLEAIAAARAPDLALLVRIGDAHRRTGDLDAALAWYGRASKLVPDVSLPGFLGAQMMFDAGRLAEAARAYTGLQRFREDLPSAEQALGVIALRQARWSEAAWYLRRATRGAPREVLTWRALAAAELGRKDGALALDAVTRALTTWPRDGELLYLAGMAHVLLGDRDRARARLVQALDARPDLADARRALGQLDIGAAPAPALVPALLRPWGDAAALQDTLDRFGVTAATMSSVRTSYQMQVLTLLGALGKGPFAPGKRAAVRTCPLGRVAPLWASAQGELRRYERLGVDLEAEHRYLARHDEVGATAGLLPNARTQLALAKRAYRTALADVSELRAEWTRGLAPELRAAGCTDPLLAAAVANPARYRVIVEDAAEVIPPRAPPRTRPRATFYVDNTRCADPVDVWIDGAQLGQVAPGRRSALVSDGGERTLCLLGPGAAQCGDRGTVRQIYLHDGWSVTMYCPN